MTNFENFGVPRQQVRINVSWLSTAFYPDDMVFGGFPPTIRFPPKNHDEALSRTGS